MNGPGAHETPRPAVVGDARALATINIRAWQAAYRGLLPGRYLDRLSIPERVPEWEARIAAPGPGVGMFVLEVGGEVVSYCIAGPYRASPNASGPELPVNTGEIIAIYADPAHWDTGAGGRIFDHGVEALRAAGFERAVLWMLEGNRRAAAFYERRGWRPDGGRQSEPLTGNGQLLATEVRYARAL